MESGASGIFLREIICPCEQELRQVPQCEWGRGKEQAEGQSLILTNPRMGSPPFHSLLTSCHEEPWLSRASVNCQEGGAPSILLSPTPGTQAGTRGWGTKTEPLGG